MSDRSVVLFAGGGTGGHLYPALALADALLELRPDVEVAFAGAERGIEARVLPERGVEHFLLPVRGFARGVPIWKNLGVLPALLGSLLDVGEWVQRNRPAAVVVTGGYAGGPAGLVAAVTGIPLALQEQNAVPGATTRALSRWAAQVHVAYPEAREHLPASGRAAVRVSGNPIRPPRAIASADARGFLGLDPALPMVLVVGGSQGSAALNEAMLDAIGQMDEAPAYQVFWSTGPRHIASIEAALERSGAPAWVHATGYIDDMPEALAAADVAISRAGAMATSELLAWGVPAVLVPLPTAAAGHQERNAVALEGAGCAIHAAQADLDGAGLIETLGRLLEDPARLARMREAALERAQPQAARDIARQIADLLPTAKEGGMTTRDSTDAVRLDTVEGSIHFMGIGGAGMCALAELMHRRGLTVTGCDRKESAPIRRLRELGVSVTIGHDASHVRGAGAVVVTAAVPAEHPELAAARSAGIPVWKRAAVLGAVAGQGRVVAIAGTHGKTSTTAVTVQLLQEADLDPTGLVGGTVADWGGNLRVGGDLYVVEADEYDRSFHHLAPDVAVVTNLEADHLDIYGSLDGVHEAFHTFLAGLRPGGRAIVCADDPGASTLLPRLGADGYTYGTSAGSQLRAHAVVSGPDGTRFRVSEDGRDVGDAMLPVPGRHSLRNALAGAAVARWLGADWAAIRRGWAAHRGVRRRFDRLGAVAGIEIVDDYAHHPTEIVATLAAAREAWPTRRLVVVFQPHLFSRTRDFADDFGRVLAQADVAWVTEIFPAREQPISGVDHHLVRDAIQRAGGTVREHGDLETLHDAVADEVREGDVVIAMGAGSIEHFGPRLIARLEEVVHA